MTIQEIREKACYGCTLKEFRESLMMTDWTVPSSVIMLSMSIQSDVQEYMDLAPNDPVIYAEKVRQLLNLSKYCLGQATKLINSAEVSPRMPNEWGVSRGVK